MDVINYIKYYKDIVPKELCNEIIKSKETFFTPSTYSTHIEKNGTAMHERVKMDEFWIRKNSEFYEPIKACYTAVIVNYKNYCPDFTIQHTTDFRINRYSEGHFMSRHVDNIHHSHGQQWGYPQVSSLLFLNDDYTGGKFNVANTFFNPEIGSALIFPSNFMYPHSVDNITKGTRWSIVTWLM